MNDSGPRRQGPRRQGPRHPGPQTVQAVLAPSVGVERDPLDRLLVALARTGDATGSPVVVPGANGPWRPPSTRFRWRDAVPPAAVLAGLVVLAFLWPSTGRSASLGAALPTAEFSIPVPPTLPPASAVEIDEVRLDPTPLPHRLIIPSLGVNAAIAATIDFTPSGELHPPDDGATVGIWAGGAGLAATTGQGTTLLVGHVQTRTLAEGALFHLAAIQARAAILVTDDQGRPSAWVVTQAYTRPKVDPPTDLYQPGGPRRLALVTCGGPDLASSVIVIAEPAPTSQT